MTELVSAVFIETRCIWPAINAQISLGFNSFDSCYYGLM